MVKRGQKGKGRVKVEIKKIEDMGSRYCTFSKRRNGLFGKAKELNALCGADVAVIVFSPRDRLYTYGQPSVELVADQFLREQALQLHDKNICGNVHSDNSGYSGTEDVCVEREDFLVDKREQEKNILETENNSFLWDVPIEDLELHELEQCKASIEEFKRRVANRLDEMVMRRACLKDFLGMNSNAKIDSSSG